MSIENIITPWDTLEKRKRMLKFDINSTLKEATTEDFSLIGRQPEPNDGILHFTSDRFITLNGMIYGTGGGFYDLNPLYEKMNGKNIETDEEADEFVASYGAYEFLPYVHYHINSSAYTLTTFMCPSSVFQIKNAYDGAQYYRVYNKSNSSNPWTPVKLKWDTNSNKYIINKFENSSIATLSDPIPTATNTTDGLMSSDHVNSLSSTANLLFKNLITQNEKNNNFSKSIEFIRYRIQASKLSSNTDKPYSGVNSYACLGNVTQIAPGSDLHKAIGDESNNYGMNFLIGTYPYYYNSGNQYKLGFCNGKIAFTYGTTEWSDWTVLASQSYVYTSYNNLYSVLQSNANSISSLDILTHSHTSSINTLNETTNTHSAAITKLNDTTTNLSSSIKSLSGTVSTNYTTLDGKISGNTTSITNLDTKFNTHAAAITKLETEQSKQSYLLNNLNTSVNSINSNISDINTKISTVTNDLNNLKISYNKLYDFTINKLSYIETWISDFQTARPTTLPPSGTSTPTPFYDLCIYVNNNAYIDNNDSNIAYLSYTNTGSMEISNNLNGSVRLDLSNKDNYEIIGEQPTQYLKFQCKSNSLDFDAFMYTRFSGIITLNQGNLWVSSVMLYNGNNISAITTPPNTYVLKEANYISFDKIFSITGDTKVAYIDLELTTAQPSGSTLAPTTLPPTTPSAA